MPGSFGKYKNPAFAAVDVGFHSIKGVICETGGTVPRISAKRVVNFPVFYNPRGESAALERLALKVRKFVLDLTQNSENVPERALLAVGSGLATVSIKRWCTSRSEAGRTVTRNEAKNIFEKFKNKNAGGTGAFIYPLEYTVSERPLRAEKIRIPQGANLCFRAVLLAFPEEIAPIFTDIQKTLGGVRIEIVPLALAEYYAAVSGLKIQNALLADIGGEKTNLIHVKNGLLAQVESFPLGGRHFIRGIAKITKTSLEEAEDLKRQYIQGTIGGKARVLLRDLLRGEVKSWEDMFAKKTARLYPSESPPQQIFLCGGGAHLMEINLAVRNGGWIKSLPYPYTERPRVNILGADTLFGGNSLGGNLQGPEEFGLSSLVYYLFKNQTV